MLELDKFEVNRLKSIYMISLPVTSELLVA